MTFGNTTVTFVHLTEDLGNRDRYGNPVQVNTNTDVAGCLFRPTSFKEVSPLATQEVAQSWKCTAPPAAAAMGATATDAMIVDGITYQVVGGAEVFSDFSGLPYKVTIHCVLQLY